MRPTSIPKSRNGWRLDLAITYVVSVTGEGMDSANVDALYLTNDTEDVQVQIVQQQEKLIKFKVPT